MLEVEVTSGYRVFNARDDTESRRRRWMMRWTCEVRARERPAGVLVMVITITMDWTPGTAGAVPDSYAFGIYVLGPQVRPIWESGSPKCDNESECTFSQMDIVVLG